MFDWTGDYSDSQTQQSIVTKLLSGILSLTSRARSETGHFPSKRMVSAKAMT